MKQLTIVIAVIAVIVAALVPGGVAQAQGRATDIPAAHRPPKGMCRIWLDNVPPSQQPAPTDCPTALRHRPANGRVIFGNDYVDGGKENERDEAGRDSRAKLPPFVNSFGRPSGRVPVPLVRRRDQKAKRPSSDSTPPDHGD